MRTGAVFLATPELENSPETFFAMVLIWTRPAVVATGRRVYRYSLAGMELWNSARSLCAAPGLQCVQQNTELGCQIDTVTTLDV
jgi:hypothetical protein